MRVFTKRNLRLAFLQNELPAGVFTKRTLRLAFLQNELPAGVFTKRTLRLAGWRKPTRGQITNLPHIGHPGARLESTTWRRENDVAVTVVHADDWG
jgi:hypothetical protein